MKANKYEAKSVVFGRMPRKEGAEFKTAFFKLYKTEKPLQNGFPEKEMEFPDIEKVQMKDETLEYYLEGNDIVIDGIKSVTIEEKNHVLKLKFER